MLLSITELDRWVGENNIPSSFECSKGWWDYVELIRRFSHKFDVEDVRVVGHYIVSRPSTAGAERRGRLIAVERISDAELAAAMAAQIDADGRDLALETWSASLTDEQRELARANVRAWVVSARQALGLETREPRKD